MSRDVKDRVAARQLSGEPALVIQIAFDHFDGQAGDIPPVALLTNQSPDLMPITQQLPRKMGADEAGGACDECSHRKGVGNGEWGMGNGEWGMGDQEVPIQIPHSPIPNPYSPLRFPSLECGLSGCSARRTRQGERSARSRVSACPQ